VTARAPEPFRPRDLPEGDRPGAERRRHARRGAVRVLVIVVVRAIVS
jgi:hypothetical protein